MADRVTGRTRTPFHRQLYFWVLPAVALGILTGWHWPSVGVELKPIGTGFINLIKMMIAPVIFCTIALGVGSVRKASKVGTVGASPSATSWPCRWATRSPCPSRSRCSSS